MDENLSDANVVMTDQPVKTERTSPSPKSSLFVSADDEAMPDIKPDVEDDESTEFSDKYISAPLPTNDNAQLALFTTKSYDKMAWRLCDQFEHLSFLQKVKVKEHALKQGTIRMTGLKHQFQAAQSFLPNVLKRIEMIGSGKSTVINALLGYPDLLPSHSSKACTAVCVMITWNRDDDPNAAFRAKFTCIDEVDWRNEIEALIQDINDESRNRNNQDGDDGNADSDRTERIFTAFQKVTSVYPFIKDAKDLLACDITELMNHPNVKSHLGQDIAFYCSDLKDFALRIKVYIDSTNLKQDDGTAFSLWPLVKLARLDLKSPILRDGLCLVDLPGSHDTNAARSAVAARFQKSLAVCCVVASSKRAASEKPAQDILGKYRQQELQLDDKFSATKLCFIISMSDAFIEPTKYLRDNPKVRRGLSKVLKEQAENAALRKKAEQFQHEKVADESRIQVEYKQKRLEKGTVIAQYRPFYVRHEAILKRKRDGKPIAEQSPEAMLTDVELLQADSLRKQIKDLDLEINDLKATALKTTAHLYNAQNILADIKTYEHHCLSRIMHACVQDRYQDSALEIRKYFDGVTKTGKKKKSKGPELQVFNVSAHAHTLLFQDQPLVGFETVNRTGIPALQEWLIETTLPTRKKNSEAVLDSIISLELSLAICLADKTVGHKMQEHTMKSIESVFRARLEELNTAFETCNLDLTNSCKKVVGNLFTKFPKLELAATTKVDDTVRSWAKKPMHWSTHRATNKNHGMWKRRGKDGEDDVFVDWNRELASLYLDPLIPQWQTTIHNKLPASRTVYVEKVEADINDFAEQMRAMVLSNCPEIENEVTIWESSTKRTAVRVDKHTANVFKNVIAEKATNTHPLIAAKILDAWEPVYAECALASGKGHYKRNQKLHLDHAEKIKRKMFQKGSAAIRDEFAQLWKDVPQEFETGTTLIVQQIVDEFETMLDNHTLLGANDIQNKEFLAKKKELQQITAQIFQNLRVDWSKALEFEVVKKEKPAEVPMPNLDKLYASPEDCGSDDFIDLSND